MTRMIRFLVLVTLLFPVAAFAEVPTSQPLEGVKYWRETRTEPAMSLYVVQVDLKNPNLQLRVSRAGDDPDGDGEWQTVLMPPSKIAEREHFDVCINASFFSARFVRDIEGKNSGYVAGVWASPEGITICDGKKLETKPRKNWPLLVVDENAHVTIGSTDLSIDHAKQAVQGNALVLENGNVVEPKTEVMKARHPRTVIGLDRDGKTLTILTVDGRRPGVSIGMTGSELGAEMQRLGCETAMNLDGGGSTELVLRDPETAKLKVMNQPSDGRERAVADVIGISVRGVKRGD